MEPIFVMEGYVKKGTNLENCIKEIGLTTLLNATLAHEDQYASDTCQDPINGEEAIADIERYKNGHKLLSFLCQV